MKINQYKNEKPLYNKKGTGLKGSEREQEIKDVVSLGNSSLEASFPITLPDQPDEIYKAMEKKVADLDNLHPPGLEKTWEDVSQDGHISGSDKNKLDRTMGDWKIGGLTLKDGTDEIEAHYIKSWLDMEKSGQIKMDPEVKEAYDAELKKREEKLSKGEILAGRFVTGDGILHELTEGVAPIPYEEFIKKLNPGDWGISLADRKGGEVRVTARDEENRPVKQMERMVVDSILSKLLPVFAPMDMTKVETIKWDKDGAKINWEVLKSDNNTVLSDVGSVTFEAFGEKSTKITFHSAHRLNNFPANLDLDSVPLLEGLRDKAMAKSLSDFFVGQIKHYRELVS